MSIRVYEDVGAAKLNQMQKIGRVESVGPITVVAMNESSVANAVLAFRKERTGAGVFSDRDTKVSAENTGYTGNGVLLAFTGQSLDHTPVVPGTLVLTPATSGPILTDLFGDGFVYMPDGFTKAGTINYFTGALTLNYPVGSPPNGQINALYWYQNAALVHGGQKNFTIASGLPDDAMVVFAASDNKLGAEVKIESAASWI